MNTIAYIIKNNLYLNITNSCSNDCTFCIRQKPHAFNDEFELWLDHEPSEVEILTSIKQPETFDEIVFCGYGEPLTRLAMVKSVAKYLKNKGCMIRVDTNGTSNLIHKKNIVPELVGLVDTVSISLNAHNAELYSELCCPKFGIKTFEEVLKFARLCKKLLPRTQLTVVEFPKVDIPACQKIADDIGVTLKIRRYYEEDYAGFK
ncbi:MAG: radical SAM protein [Candidatus Margulisiibacteriota bacterium]|nr:MAG: hypothetical protein A2X43_03785 [Candidatus Margulisbacteria bacterium GWD2_39_127]OGI10958.1 MAG: hypothetical protein A2X41_01785 [Candidatus Margulisbacteria bacterium GWE2_39_32]PZM83153.1 MAG: radical SAM protein [Candidatus Margulisiibacteriota bacterium]HAR62546.1 radical SAM protein [Candidatus Margulisiibacteriota bacterium]HCY38089.1 radical SAM protein [Candidatus Margulisiibacteriota bacterium]